MPCLSCGTAQASFPQCCLRPAEPCYGCPLHCTNTHSHWSCSTAVHLRDRLALRLFGFVWFHGNAFHSVVQGLHSQTVAVPCMAPPIIRLTHSLKLRSFAAPSIVCRKFSCCAFLVLLAMVKQATVHALSDAVWRYLGYVVTTSQFYSISCPCGDVLPAPGVYFGLHSYRAAHICQ